MNIWTIAAAAGLLLQTPSHAEPQSISPTLRRAAEQYDRAQISGDRRLLELLLASDYALVNSGGTTETKAQFIADLTDPSFHLSPYKVLKPIERQWLAAAVLGGVVRLKGTDHGHAFDTCLRFSDVWVKRGHRWQVVYTQASRAAADECQ